MNYGIEGGILMTAMLVLGMEHCCLGDRLLLEMLNIAMALQARALKDGKAVAMAEAVLHCWCHRHHCHLPGLMYISYLYVVA